MSLENIMRRLGVGKGRPEVRRMLSLRLQSEIDARGIERLAEEAALRAPADQASALLEDWLRTGDWRAVRDACREADGAPVIAEQMPLDRLQGLAAVAVLADRRRPADVAADLGQSLEFVHEAVQRSARQRGIPKDRVDVILGLRDAPLRLLPARGLGKRESLDG